MKALIIASICLLALWCGKTEGLKKTSTVGGQPEILSGCDISKDVSQGSRSEEKQQNPFKKIRLHFKTPGQFYDKIEFWDEESQALIKTIDLETLNPFNRLPFETIGESYGAKQYDLREIDPAQLEQQIGNWDVPGSIADKTPLSANGQILVFDGPTMEHFTVVAFNLYLTNSHQQVIAIMADYLVINDTGDITFQFRSNKGGSMPVVTQDGKYVAVHYGGQFGDDEYLPEGLLFYQAKGGEIIFTDTLSSGTWAYYFPIHDYIVSIEQFGGGMNLKERYSFYKIKDGKKYSRMFDYKSLGRPGVVTPEDYEVDGVYYSIYELNGKKYSHGVLREKALFAKDFQVDNL